MYRIKLSLILLMCSFGLQSYSQQVNVGVITDYPNNPELSSFLNKMISEFDRTTGVSKSIVLSPENVGYGLDNLVASEKAYADMVTEVDIIVLLGAISVKGAVLQGSFPVPTFGIGVIDPYLQNIPYASGSSGVENFTYLWQSRQIDAELKSFYELIPFEHLTLIVDENAILSFDPIKTEAAIDSLRSILGTKITVVDLKTDIAGSLAAIPEGSDAVYVASTDGKSAEEIKVFAAGLIEKKLPSFSGSKWHVDNGILASVSDENDAEQALRKLAIMVDEALSGAQLADMQVSISLKEDFFLNMETARAIGFYPPYEILFTANIIGEDDHNGTVYSLEQIMEKSLAANLNIQISYQEIEITEQDLRSAKSNILPQLGAEVTGSQLNPDQSIAGIQPERQLDGSLVLQQVLFSEEVLAGIRISKYLKSAQEYATEADILDVLLDTYFEYFNLLAAKTNLAIQEENLATSLTNLELSRLRVNVGSATNAEVYRWDSEVSRARQAVIQGNINVESGLLRLNTFLANTLEDNYDIQDQTLDGEMYLSLKNSQISASITNTKDIKRVSDFLVQESMDQNPNKKFLLENINAAQRQYDLNKRLLYTPVVALQASAGQVFNRSGRNSEDLGTYVDNPWNVGVSVSYPIFQGQYRRAQKQKAQIQLDQFGNSEIQLDQNLALAVRTTVLQNLGTSTNIYYSEKASENAALNFGLVQDGYEQGSINITQLIDAQKAALNAQLDYTVSVYDFLSAHLQLEYAVGYFSMFTSAEETQEFEQRLLQFINQ